MFLLVVSLVFVMGCGSPITKSNYEKVKTGMSESEVTAILGKGEEMGSSSMELPAGMSIPGMPTSAKMVKWQEGMKIVTITFMGGKVSAKAQNGL